MFEMLVIDVDEPLWLRGFAAWKLLQAWCAFRHDDHRGAAPHDIEEEDGAYVFVLRRTKTTGRGKKVEIRRVPISTEAYLEDPSWIGIGLHIIRDMGAQGRDYLMPSPERELAGGRPCELTYQEAAGWSRAVYRRFGLTLGYEQRDAEVLGQHFTEHSGRSFLTTAAMHMGATEEFLKPLGGWGARAPQSYMKAAVARILQVQRRVATRARAAWGVQDVTGEAELLVGLARHYRDHGKEADQARQAAALSAVATAQPTRPSTWDDTTPEDQPLEDHSASSGMATAPERDGIDDERTPNQGYVISITPKTNFRRLHYFSRCHRHPGVHYQQYEWMGDQLPSEDAYDDYCKQCWRSSAPAAASSAQEHHVDDIQGSDPEGSEVSGDHSSSTGVDQ
jgi:hypothetical protein